jgi:GMP synthase-like glutamine amidotransferase
MLHIIQNDRDVPPGNFSDTIGEMGISSRVVRPYAGEGLPAATEVSAAIVLGGAMGVHDDDKYPFLVEVKDFIRECARTETPLLGVCLGGQLLADVLGGDVAINSPHREKGTLSVTLTPAGEKDPLFAGISREFVTFQWHNDSFTVPADAVLLASSDACPGQAFRFGSVAWGTQFHPEVDRSIVECWVRWSKKTAPFVDRFLDDFTQTEQPYLEVSRRLLGNFLRVARLI